MLIVKDEPFVNGKILENPNFKSNQNPFFHPSMTNPFISLFFSRANFPFIQFMFKLLKQLKNGSIWSACFHFGKCLFNTFLHVHHCLSPTELILNQKEFDEALLYFLISLALRATDNFLEFCPSSRARPSLE